MRNRGPGKWREWRYSNLVVPLYVPDPKEKPNPDDKPLNEVAHQTLRAMMAKNALPKLMENLNELIAAPDSPGGRISETRFRATLKDTAQAHLSVEEFEAMYPRPVEDTPAVRRASKILRRRSLSKERQASKESVDSKEGAK
mmetsp:Transcript_96636/g.167728  ORF Transcript_96636/g.167728 Transcript_96636/m.167728 type:complete len:142 (+) Transcript_96636:50-475(+)